MRFHLVDANNDVVAALAKAFARFTEVDIQNENLLAVARHCIVSPANSFGFMDGGIDASYREFFGPIIERKVRDAIDHLPEKVLAVGSSIVVTTDNSQIPYMIIAPTMIMPEAVESRNCYRAMRAVLRIAERHPEISHEIFCPGLGTGVGMVNPEDAAVMMANAYGDWSSARKTRSLSEK